MLSLLIIVGMRNHLLVNDRRRFAAGAEQVDGAYPPVSQQYKAYSMFDLTQTDFTESQGNDNSSCFIVFCGLGFGS